MPGCADHEVWGSQSFLSRRDQIAPDESEGVPWLYEMKIKVKWIPQIVAGAERRGNNAGEEIETIVSVDVQGITGGKIEKEYVIWIRKAIEDAKLCGLPDTYAAKYILRVSA